MKTKILLSILLWLITLSARAGGYLFKVDGIAYNYNSTHDGVMVVYPTINPPTVADPDLTDKDIVIPASVTYGGRTYNVTAIGEYAFRYCKIKSITIPNTVTTIGKQAFYECRRMISLSIGNSVTSIEEKAFFFCDELTELTIPNSVKTIGDLAFAKCYNLKSVSIGKSVTSIGNNVFDECSGITRINFNAASCTEVSGSDYTWFKSCPLTSITIGTNVKNIPAYLAYGQTTLTSVIIQSSATSIGDYAFSGCTKLTSIIIPNSVKSINRNAFSGCKKITSVTLGNSITNIGSNAFSQCTGIKNVKCDAITPPNLTTQDFPINTLVSVPSNALYSYINNTNWKKYYIVANDLSGYTTLGSNKSTGSFGGSGSGTANDPYLIFNPIHLYNVRNFTGYSDVYFKLMADIDLSEFIADNSPNEGWEPIGSTSSPFMGHFDGDRHTISGLKINRNIDYVGFFSCLSGAEIKNLKISGSTEQGKSHIGSLASVSQNSTITMVNVNINVNGTNFAGGLIGVSQGNDNITSCSFDGNVYCSGDYTGGVSASSKNLKVTNSTIWSSKLQGGQNTGGLIGYGTELILNGNNVIINSITGTIFTSGIAGYVTNSEITNINGTYTSITGNSSTGCFAGYASKTTLSNNTSTFGNIIGTTYTGGAIGSGWNLKINKCYAFGNTIKADSYSGGFIGQLEDTNSSITCCGAVLDLYGKTPVGGFVGQAVGTLNNLFAIGDITSESGLGNGTGGLIGNMTSGSLTNSYYSGNSNARNSYVGGILGNVTNTIISKNYSIGSISGQQYVGGVFGYAKGNSSVTSNVSACDVVNSINGNVGRVFGAKESTVTIGAIGTTESNRGLTTMRIISQGLQITPTDGEQHGVNIGKSLLKYKSTFQGINWDFTNDWTILETESFPYKPEQCAPPVINKATSGATTVTGNCVSGASVYVTVESKKYEAQVSGNTWTATVAPLSSGATVRAYATISDKIQSYIVSTVVGYAGSGTEDNPYLIYTANDLANINSYSYYKVMNDIDLTEWINANSPNQGWIPIGSAGGGTMKQLDGNGKTITGLWFDLGNQSNCGLVSAIENATIKNLTVKMATGKTSNGGAYTGILVGKATNSTLTGINVEGSVKGTNYVAGIAGIATGSVVNNCNATNITASGTGYVAGITGNTNKPIQDCKVTNATLTATADYAGGVAGKLANAATNCSVQATINGKNYTGGIAGDMTGDAAYCQAEINLTGADYIGGIAGNTTGNVSLSTTTGQIITTDNTNRRAGGIAGYTKANIINCYSSARTAGGKYAGGIVGYTFGKVNNCYSNGDIASVFFGAGIAGYLDGANAAVNHCFANNNRIDVNAQTGVAMRVIGGIKNGAPTPQATNFANKAMVVSVNDVTQTIYDDVLEGKGVQLATLKQQATYTAQGWDFNETWGIKEGEGFPYLKWTVVEPEPEFVTGDANGDGFVRISDIVTTANFILGDEPAGFVFAAADVDQNNYVRINDLVLIANIILDGGMNAPAKVAAMQLAGNDYMTAQGVEIKAGETRFIDIELNNDNAFSALQMDINLPDGLMLKGATLTGRADGHNLMTGRTVNGKATIAVFSTESNNFAGNNGAVIRLEVMATGNVTEDITLDNIFASTAKGVLKQLDAVSVGVNAVSSINDITVGNGLVNVYNTAGQLVRRNANASEATRNLPAGLYLVGGKKVVVK